AWVRTRSRFVRKVLTCAALALATSLPSIAFAQGPAESRPGDRKEVLDFCFMTPRKDESRYQKQRVVIFGVAGEDVATAPEAQYDDRGNRIQGGDLHVFRDVDMSRHLQEVFSQTYPMKRLYTVEAS